MTSDREEQAQQDRATAVEHEQCEAEHVRLTDGIAKALGHLRFPEALRNCRSHCHKEAASILEELL